MKLTMRWLADFVELPTADPAEIAGALESMGHEVEAYHQLTADFERVVIGRVTGIAAHPDADKIRVCTVDVGDPAGDSEIVCGAWNFAVGARGAGGAARRQARRGNDRAAEHPVGGLQRDDLLGAGAGPR